MQHFVMEYFAVFDGALQGFLGAYAMGHGLLAGCVQLLARWRNRLFRAQSTRILRKGGSIDWLFCVYKKFVICHRPAVILCYLKYSTFMHFIHFFPL